MAVHIKSGASELLVAAPPNRARFAGDGWYLNSKSGRCDEGGSKQNIRIL